MIPGPRIYRKTSSPTQRTTQFFSSLLVVDDHENLRKLTAIFLGHLGYNVLEAANGKTAIHSATNENPKFILLNLHLEVVRTLHKMPQTAEISIVGWTGYYISPPEQQDLIAEGFIDCLKKPVKPRTLEAIVERFVPKPKF